MYILVVEAAGNVKKIAVSSNGVHCYCINTGLWVSHHLKYVLHLERHSNNKTLNSYLLQECFTFLQVK